MLLYLFLENITFVIRYTTLNIRSLYMLLENILSTFMISGNEYHMIWYLSWDYIMISHLSLIKLIMEIYI